MQCIGQKQCSDSVCHGQTCPSIVDRTLPHRTFLLNGQSADRILCAKSRLGNSKKLYAHVRKHLVEVYCYDKGKLLLINSFPCKQTADCIYYLLYIWQQLAYNQEKDELQLTGKFKDKEGLLTGLRKYLRQVFIINPKAEFNRSEISKIEDIPFDMQTLILCE